MKRNTFFNRQKRNTFFNRQKRNTFFNRQKSIYMLFARLYAAFKRQIGVKMNRVKTAFNPVQLLFLLKVGIGSAISILLAGSLGLLYSPSAGIITLLTIQNTRKETLSIAIKRLLSFLLAVTVSFLVFSLMGYTYASFGLFILFFVGLCTVFGLKDGISMNAVLMTHFLIEKHMELTLIGNEVLLLLVGMGIGILFNMIMPNYKAGIRREQTALEEEMKRTLKSLADTLQDKEACLGPGQGQEAAPASCGISYGSGLRTVDFSGLDAVLDGLLRKAYEDAGNTLLNNTRYMVSYLEMRKLQVDVLKNIAAHIGRIPVVLRQSLPIADFLIHTAESFHELNNVVGLLEEMERLNLHYKNETLPATREEFEYRAILFQILKELEYFLLLKRNFVLELEKKNMKSYWNRT